MTQKRGRWREKTEALAFGHPRVAPLWRASRTRQPSHIQDAVAGRLQNQPAGRWQDGETADKALAEIQTVVAESIAWMREEGETPPEPLGSTAFKGNILFRTTSETHRELSTRAQEAGISLNQYLQTLVQRHLVAATVEKEVHHLSRAVSRIERRLKGSAAAG